MQPSRSFGLSGQAAKQKCPLFWRDIGWRNHKHGTVTHAVNWNKSALKTNCRIKIREPETARIICRNRNLIDKTRCMVYCKQERFTVITMNIVYIISLQMEWLELPTTHNAAVGLPILLYCDNQYFIFPIRNNTSIDLLAIYHYNEQLSYTTLIQTWLHKICI